MLLHGITEQQQDGISHVFQKFGHRHQTTVAIKADEKIGNTICSYTKEVIEDRS